MPLTKCARCAKLFNKVQSPVCPACQPDEDADVEKIRGVIERDGNLSAEQLAERAEVELAVVHRMLDQGMLASTITTESVRCGRCGAPAISPAKRLCGSCLDKLNAEVARAQSTIKLGEKRAPVIGGTGNVHQAFDEKRRS